jgi:4-hydroxythreonine-4-phosphate dehydrogenase
VLDVANAAYVIDTLNKATDLCIQGRYHAMVTAPVHKSVIAEAGYNFMGHTEYLAERCGVKKVVMMLCGHPQVGQDIFPKMLRVALATTHIPLAQVPVSLTVEDLKEIIQITHDDLRNKFGIVQPKIALTGLNPHAGESGKMGTEEIEIILPAINWAKQRGIEVYGPYPGDTIFTPEHLRQYDLIIAMQHDQGLAPFKMLTFGQGVNVTLGLPIIRTSVDHGTALSIAGKNKADDGSMLAALELAYQLAKQDATSS